METNIELKVNEKLTKKSYGNFVFTKDSLIRNLGNLFMESYFNDFINEIEKEFEIEIPKIDYMLIPTVGCLLNYINFKIDSKYK